MGENLKKLVGVVINFGIQVKKDKILDKNNYI